MILSGTEPSRKEAKEQTKINLWPNPTRNGFPIEATRWEWPKENQVETVANKDAADLFCKWKNYDYASSWTIGKDEAIASRGTQRFSTSNPGQPRYCDFCRWHIRVISCVRRIPSERRVSTPWTKLADIDLIYKEVLGRDAKPAIIAGHVNDLTKGRTLSEIRSQIANSEEAKNKINSIYQEVLGRDAGSYEQKSQMDLLAEGATLSSIRAGIARTSSLLQNGNVISLECLGHLPGSKFLDGRAGNAPIALTALLDGQSTGTKWKVHVINDGVIALENQGKIPGSTWLNGLTFANAVNLAPDTEHPNTGTKWRIHIINDGVIALENQGHVPGSTWLDGETGGGKVKLVAYPHTGFTGAKWRVIGQY